MNIYDKAKTFGQSLKAAIGVNDAQKADIEKVMSALKPEVEAQFEKSPPTLGVIGLSGVGKSSTINAMFGTQLKTSATVRGTTKFESIRARLSIKRGEATGGLGFLRVYDAPGLGEDRDVDPTYIQMYQQHLPKCDVALWLVAARNRALALDQTYLDKLGQQLHGKTVFGISQADLVEPNDWERQKNLPSEVQRQHLDEIVQDRSERLSKALGVSIKCIPFSATNYFNLMELYEHIVSGAPKERRWMFEMVRSFSAEDWLKQAEGISDTQRAAIIAKYGVAEPLKES